MYFSEYYLIFMIFILFFVVIITYGSGSYYKGKLEGLQKEIDALEDEIAWLHLNLNEEKYKEFYRE